MKLVWSMLLLLCACTKVIHDQENPRISIISPANNAVFKAADYVPVHFKLTDNRQFQSILFQCIDTAGNVVWHPKPGFPFHGAMLLFRDSFENKASQTTMCKMRLLVIDKSGNRTDTNISFTLLH